jgi:hypothetical protein
MATNASHHITNYQPTTTPVQVGTERYPARGRLDLSIWNIGSVTLWLGTSNAVASSGAGRGIPIYAGQSYSDNATTGDVWIVAESGTGDCVVDEVY